MLKLYSFGPAANSMKPLLTLYEKGLAFEKNRLDPAKFEHHTDWFKAINPRGQVPALVDGAHVITESTVICEYLEDEYPTEVSLRPATSAGKAAMRVWTKWVDEYFCWCVSTIGWHRYVGNMVKALSDAEFEAKVAAIPVVEQ
jgi:glutathione S-transferase